MRSALLVAGSVLAALLAGCTEPARPLAPPEPAPAVETTDAVDWSATLTGACVVMAGGHFCMSGPGVSGSGNTDDEPTYVHDARGRTLAGGQLVLEWEANAPTTESLRLVATAFTGCPDDCEANRTLGSAIGRSPLALQVPPLDAEGLEVVVRIEKVDFAPGIQASHGQPVRLGGTLVFLETPAEATAPSSGNPSA